MMKTSDFDYDLPPDLIAQEPLSERDSSRLMLLDRETGEVSHHVFRELPALLRRGDLVVLNDTRVVPARLFGWREETGGKVEVLLLEDMGGGRWRAFTRSGGKLRPGEYLKLAGGRARARLAERLGEEGDILEMESREPVEEIMETAGYMPVPPYIKRVYDVSGQEGRRSDAKALDERTLLDRERYQTTYARVSGAVAAPTAGLHFTERVFGALEERGIERAFVTLHVGPGTFRPVKSEAVEEHRMDPERYDIPARTVERLARARARGGRVVAVGTTVTRTLEYAAGEDGSVRPGRGEADLFITPGYEFKVVDALVTNFHLPKGTPLLLTSAFAGNGPRGAVGSTTLSPPRVPVGSTTLSPPRGEPVPDRAARRGRDRVLAAYAVAAAERYRFLSYGDAMLIL